MEKNKNPLSPHLQIYRWQISSLLSISHRIIGVINIFFIILICFWSLSLLLDENNYELTKLFLNTFFGKFFIISFCWTSSFHILNEIRHFAWDLGFGFDIKTAKITGSLVIIGSFILTILFFLIGKNLV